MLDLIQVNPKARRHQFGASAVLHVLVAALLLSVHTLPIAPTPPRRHLLMPLVADTPAPPPRQTAPVRAPRLAISKSLTLPAQPPVRHIDPPVPPPVAPPRVEIAQSSPPVPPPISQTVAKSVAPDAPPILKPEVRTNVFGMDGGKTEPRRPNLDAKPSTGGFEGPAGGRASSTSPVLAVQMGGFGASAGGPARTGRGTYEVASAGFGQAASAGGGHALPAQEVKPGSFGDATKPTGPSRAPAAALEAPTTPIEIVSKPRPVYTAEARALKLEGSVALEVVFAAGGLVRVQRVLQGLGHGLDEAAIAAAEKIVFKPAQRAGQAVDFQARIQILFQLAY